MAFQTCSHDESMKMLFVFLRKKYPKSQNIIAVYFKISPNKTDMEKKHAVFGCLPFLTIPSLLILGSFSSENVITAKTECKKGT